VRTWELALPLANCAQISALLPVGERGQSHGDIATQWLCRCSISACLGALHLHCHHLHPAVENLLSETDGQTDLPNARLTRSTLCRPKALPSSVIASTCNGPENGARWAVLARTQTLPRQKLLHQHSCPLLLHRRGETWGAPQETTEAPLALLGANACPEASHPWASAPCLE
jgi:hypothetical protein